nr:hypothetical protein P5640_17000 [Bacillus subtilis]
MTWSTRSVLWDRGIGREEEQGVLLQIAFIGAVNPSDIAHGWSHQKSTSLL